MINANANKRERLVDSAADLFHRFGIASTSLADIAKHADIPIGNVYYYFKTKEELALAAVQKRKQNFDVAYNTLDDAIADPRQRLIEALKYFETVKEDYTRYGCPVGKIIQDSEQQQDNVAKAAAETLQGFVAWAAKQFAALGHEAQAKTYAISVMSGIEGASIMAKAFNDAGIISAEIERLNSWINALPNKRIQLGKVSFRAPTEATA